MRFREEWVSDHMSGVGVFPALMAEHMKLTERLPISLPLLILGITPAICSVLLPLSWSEFGSRAGELPLLVRKGSQERAVRRVWGPESGESYPSAFGGWCDCSSPDVPVWLICFGGFLWASWAQDLWGAMALTNESSLAVHHSRLSTR